MPVPFEAILPMGIVVVLFGVVGTGFGAVKYLQNDMKPHRHTIDNWDTMMMRRDERLTGSYRGQAVDPIAPKEFATNGAWGTERT